jgi:phage terminase large subunit-like protein
MAMLMYWTHDCPAPWQTPEWIEQMRQQLRPNAYLRLIENRWVTSESNFVDMAWYDACVDAELRPELTDPRLAVWVGVDASVKRDSTAIVCCTFDQAAKKVRLVWHRIFQPSPDDPLLFEDTIERTLLDLRRRFWVREVRFDPWQMQAVAQRLTAAGLPMVEFAQSVPNLTEASTNLYELTKGRNLTVYPDDELRLAVSRCVALETSRGWRIAKEKASHKIDVVVALAQAALGAVQQGQVAGLSADDRAFMQRCQQALHAQEMRRRSCGAFDPAAPVIDYMNARGEDVARAEDRAALRAKARWGRWASW